MMARCRARQSGFELDGGPLTGLAVKGFVNDSNPCVLHFATP